ncbi:hypothetical protein [Ruminococcus sp.]|uniref:hypothetical protein n=2 Tax=Ruminococcus sp. TaxID=41978 RepID=UPI003FD84806
MSVQSYPWTVRIYKGEGRFLIVEEVEHRAGYNTYSDKITIVSEAEDNLVAKLGTEAFLGLKSIEDSLLYVGKPKQFWKNGSKYKGYITFWKHNLLTYVDLYEDGSYRVCATEKFREKKGGYYGCIKSINLPANATAEEIGNAIIDVFKAAEEYYERNPMEY